MHGGAKRLQYGLDTSQKGPSRHKFRVSNFHPARKEGADFRFEVGFLFKLTLKMRTIGGPSVEKEDRQQAERNGRKKESQKGTI